MALVTLARGQNATLTMPAPFASNTKWTGMQWQTDMNMFDVTASGDSTSLFNNDCLGDISGTAVGTPYDGTSYGRSCNVSLDLWLNGTSTDIAFKAYNFRFIKNFPMVNVTAIGDTEAKWDYGRPNFSFAASGYINTTSAGLDDLTAGGLINPVSSTVGPGRVMDMSADIDEVGVISTSGSSSELRVHRWSKTVPFRKGGPVEVSFSAMWSGANTYAVTETDFSSTNDINLATSDTTPDSGDIAIVMNDGVTVTHQIIINRVEIAADGRAGSPVSTTVKWKFT